MKTNPKLLIPPFGLDGAILQKTSEN